MTESAAEPPRAEVSTSGGEVCEGEKIPNKEGSHQDRGQVGASFGPGEWLYQLELFGRVVGSFVADTRPSLKSPLSERESLVVQAKGGQEVPRGKEFTAEKIIGELGEVEVGLASGKTVPQVVRKPGVTAQTYCR